MPRRRISMPVRLLASIVPLLALAPRRVQGAIIGAVTHNISSDSTQLTYSGTWRSDTNEGFYQAYSNATDAAVTFSFTGVAAVYLAEKTSDRGICLLTLDNTIPYTVDLYNDSGFSSGLQVIWSSGTLPYGQHNISITQIGPDARFGYYPYLVTSTWIEAVPTNVAGYLSTQSVPTSSASAVPPGGYYGSGSSVNVGAIVGGVLGAVVAGLLLGFLIYLWRRDRRHRDATVAAAAVAASKKYEGKGAGDDDPDSVESVPATARYPYGMSPYSPYGGAPPYDPYAAYAYGGAYGYAHPSSGSGSAWEAPSAQGYGQSRYYSPPPPAPRSAASSDFPIDALSGPNHAPQSGSPGLSGYGPVRHGGGGGGSTSLDDSAYHSGGSPSHSYPHHVQGAGSDSRSYAIPEI
ncbi:hypothetical protein BMF94_5805 [Rhodotorula taiwanensis]|uniref:Uncharacterized protein n=1 Tax=Rhodotorula taiwanensis TaxID=741276 RepID=A0A2S5B3Y0_9BASI|nr:hypothetical protein BMF94_5805 [Rhodotorula taiwanensis]